MTLARAAEADLCEEIADYVSSTRYERLGSEPIEAAKKSILDTIGVCLAASGLEPAVRPVVDLAREAGGRQESTILGFNVKVPAGSAAFANGALAHALDYEDRTPWGQHSGSSIVPSVLALAERSAPMHGRDMITAVAIGQDLFNRFRRHIDWRKDWNFSSVMGVFCATAACASLLRLPRDGVVSALSIASMEAAGTAEVIHAPRGNLRSLYAVFSARGAVTSALLAEKGVVGTPTIFEGEYGILRLYFDGRYDRANLVRKLGEEYLGHQTVYKPWPVVGIAQSHLHATVGLVTEYDPRPDDIAEIRLDIGDYHRRMSEPLEKRRRPDEPMHARFSLPFIVAVAATRRDVRLSDFAPAALKDPVVLALADRVIPVQAEGLDWEMNVPAARVVLGLRDGERLERVGTDIPGNPQRPLNWEDIVRKFRDCALHATQPVTVKGLDRIAEEAKRLEEADDITELVRLLSRAA